MIQGFGVFGDGIDLIVVVLRKRERFIDLASVIGAGAARTIASSIGVSLIIS